MVGDHSGWVSAIEIFSEVFSTSWVAAIATQAMGYMPYADAKKYGTSVRDEAMMKLAENQRIRSTSSASRQHRSSAALGARRAWANAWLCRPRILRIIGASPVLRDPTLLGGRVGNGRPQALDRPQAEWCLIHVHFPSETALRNEGR